MELHSRSSYRFTGGISFSDHGLAEIDASEESKVSIEPHQERVVVERDELNAKIVKLDEFIKGSVFSSLPVAEQLRLTSQRGYMKLYLGVLKERIAAF